MNAKDLLAKLRELKPFVKARYKAKEIGLFGSFVRGEQSLGSDIDVLVSFEETVRWSLYDVVAMKDELKAIFGRDIDIVEKGAVRNPFRRRSIMTNREVLYAT